MVRGVYAGDRLVALLDQVIFNRTAFNREAELEFILTPSSRNKDYKKIILEWDDWYEVLKEYSSKEWWRGYKDYPAIYIHKFRENEDKLYLNYFHNENFSILATDINIEIDRWGRTTFEFRGQPLGYKHSFRG